MSRKRLRRNLLSCLLLLLTGGCASVHLIGVEQQQYVLSDSLHPAIDSVIYRSADPFRQVLESRMKTVLCTSSAVLERGTPEGALGNFVSDVCLELGNRSSPEAPGNTSQPADFVVLNNGGLRKPLPAGPVCLADFYELMPFENQLVVLTCNGRLVKRICDFIASKGGMPVSGIRFKISSTSGLSTGVFIRGVALDTLATYRIMTADYLANGGDQFELLKSAERREDTDLKIRDALITYAQEKGAKGEHINSRTDGRISIENE